MKLETYITNESTTNSKEHKHSLFYEGWMDAT